VGERNEYAGRVIVVVGQPVFRASADRHAVDGLAARIALTAASRGRSVQLVGKAGEDPEGDAVVLALAEGGVGHVALLRDAGRPTLRAPAAPTDAADATEADIAEPDTVVSSAVPATDVSLDAGDVDLALRYLTEYAVVVLADPVDEGVVKVVSDASSWVGARLILVVAAGQRLPEDVPTDAIVFEAPDGDPDGAFALFVGSFAAALDDGEDPGDAFRSTIEADGWAVATGE
jgi:hypothetical protein